MENKDYLNDEDAADVYTLMDEEGNEQDFEMIDEYEENGVVYYAFVPYFEDPEKIIEENAELVVLKSETDEKGEETLTTIDDEEEYERIGNIFLDRIDELLDEEE